MGTLHPGIPIHLIFQAPMPWHVAKAFRMLVGLRMVVEKWFIEIAYSYTTYINKNIAYDCGISYCCEKQ